MLNTRKFLYILPDSAYIAEVLPTKKTHSFAIHAFRQINGNFIDENEFIVDNVEKLIKKIEPDEYQLVLPDFLFTNTIVDVNETTESGVQDYVKEKLLPSLEFEKDSHQVESFVLTQHRGKSKVQLSALERSLLDPIRKAAKTQKVVITDITALSWTIKSVISLEPSLSTIQIGSQLYLAEHYIGVDQAVSCSINEVDNIIETVKTLKGAEPNIQTMYLLTNALVENEIKEKLSGTLPIQQLSNFSDETEGIPSYLKQIIEAAAKTLDIPEFPVPRFNLGKDKTGTSQEPFVEEKGPLIIDESINDDDDDEISEKVPDSTIELEEELPAPTLPLKATVLSNAESKTESVVEPEEIDLMIEEKVEVLEEGVTPPTFVEIPEEPIQANSPNIVIPATVVPFTYPKSMNSPTFSPAVNPHSQPSIQRPVIRNKSGSGPLLKMVMITLVALVITVVAGVGIGFAMLRLSEKNSPLNQAIVVTPSPATTVILVSPSPTPTATASATIDTAITKVLVVNATTVPGKAGTFKKLLTSAGFKTVDTANAKGTYAEKGNYLLLAEENAELLSILEKNTKLDLTVKTTKSTEDTKDNYTAVIVLAE